MVRALLGRQARHRLTLTNPSDDTRAQAEHRRAALGYLIWPAALYEHFAAREPASSWYRTQIRQAVRFGNRWAGIALAALFWPLVSSLMSGNITATIAIYGAAVTLDFVLFVVWLRAALRYSKQAARGETFALKG